MAYLTWAPTSRPAHAPRSLAQWTSQQIQAIQPYEGVPVSVVGYLVKIKVEDTGSGESTNCHFVNPDEVDWHMPFAEHFGDAGACTRSRKNCACSAWLQLPASLFLAGKVPISMSGMTTWIIEFPWCQRMDCWNNCALLLTLNT